jgi:hypothetical protein
LLILFSFEYFLGPSLITDLKPSWVSIYFQGGLIGLAAVTVGLTTEAGPHLEVGELLLVVILPKVYHMLV